MTAHTAAPDDHDGAVRTPEHAPRALPGWLVPAGLALVTAGLLGGLVLGRGMAEAGAARVEDPVSIGFVRDMGVHHAQAVEMAEIAHRRSADPALTYMAFDILSTQQGQIGIMNGWLDLWEQSPTGPSGERMAWMGHAGPMPGMASRDEIEQLRTLSTAAMEELWLRLMIRHHRGAVPMADAAADRAQSPDVALLARKMSAGQQSEIAALQDMLRQRGLAPEPEGATTGHGGGHSDPATGAPPAHTDS